MKAIFCLLDVKLFEIGENAFIDKYLEMFWSRQHTINFSCVNNDITRLCEIPHQLGCNNCIGEAMKIGVAVGDSRPHNSRDLSSFCENV